MALAGAAMLLFVLFSPAQASFVEPAVLFMNVGKADCALVFLGERAYLVDTGSKDSAPAMMRAVMAYGIQELDGVFITHTDKDHVGGLKPLLKSDVKVARLYAPAIHTEASDESHPVYEASQKYEVPMTWLVAGDRVEAGEGLVFSVLGPISKVEDSENNNSLVMDLQTPEGNILFAGDMEFPQEEELLRAGAIPKATVLKVGHHGEDDASSTAFIATVRPKWAVISTSTQEEPDTPDPKVIKLLWAVKANVAVTQEATCGILVRLSGGQVQAEQLDYKQDPANGV